MTWRLPFFKVIDNELALIKHFFFLRITNNKIIKNLKQYFNTIILLGK